MTDPIPSLPPLHATESLKNKELVGKRFIARENIKTSDDRGGYFIEKNTQLSVVSIKHNESGDMANIEWREEVESQSPIQETSPGRTRIQSRWIAIGTLLEFAHIEIKLLFSPLKEELGSLLNKRRGIYEDDLDKVVQIANESFKALKESHGVTEKKRTIVSPDGVGVNSSLHLATPLSKNERDELTSIKVLIDKLRRSVDPSIFGRIEEIHQEILDLMVL